MTQKIALLVNAGHKNPVYGVDSANVEYGKLAAFVEAIENAPVQRGERRQWVSIYGDSNFAHAGSELRLTLAMAAKLDALTGANPFAASVRLSARMRRALAESERMAEESAAFWTRAENAPDATFSEVASEAASMQETRIGSGAPLTLDGREITNAEADAIFAAGHTSYEAHIKALQLADQMWRNAAIAEEQTEEHAPDWETFVKSGALQAAIDATCEPAPASIVQRAAPDARDAGLIAPLRIAATLADGNVIQRDYHVGTLARAVANMIAIAPDFANFDSRGNAGALIVKLEIETLR